MEEKQLVVFRLNQGEYGIDIMIVKEIIRYQKITEIPDAPEFVEGVINYRSKAVPIVDLNKRFNLTSGDVGDSTRIIIANFGDKQLGFKVDAVDEVLRIPEEDIEQVSDIAVNIDKHYITGIGKLEDRLIILLDLSKILSDDEKAELQEVQSGL